MFLYIDLSSIFLENFIIEPKFFQNYMMDIVGGLDARNLTRIIKQIFTRLDDKSLKCGTQVNVTWRELIKESFIWNERYEQIIQARLNK